jgi:hypothetical protein
MVNFDDIDDWAPKLAAALSPHVPDSVRQKLTAATPKLIGDARNLLFDLTVRNEVIDATLTWIRSTKIAGYQGCGFSQLVTQRSPESIRGNTGLDDCHPVRMHITIRSFLHGHLKILSSFGFSH